MRKAFTAAPGNALVVADYGQLELRLLAHMAGCASMRTAFELGGDFHSRTALNMYGHIQAAVNAGARASIYYPMLTLTLNLHAQHTPGQQRAADSCPAGHTRRCLRQKACNKGSVCQVDNRLRTPLQVLLPRPMPA